MPMNVCKTIGEARMKRTDRVLATCIVAGAIVAFLVWFTWDLPWQALGLGFLVGLSSTRG